MPGSLVTRMCALSVIFLVAVAARPPLDLANNCYEFWEETEDCDEFSFTDECLPTQCENPSDPPDEACQEYLQLIEPEYEECCVGTATACLPDSCYGNTDKFNCIFTPVL